jgi:hypothetical protein
MSDGFMTSPHLSRIIFLRSSIGLRSNEMVVIRIKARFEAFIF